MATESATATYYITQEQLDDLSLIVEKFRQRHEANGPANDLDELLTAIHGQCAGPYTTDENAGNRGDCPTCGKVH